MARGSDGHLECNFADRFPSARLLTHFGTLVRRLDPLSDCAWNKRLLNEAKADFKIEFEDGSSATLSLADPGSSVAVRDKNHAVEYLG